MDQVKICTYNTFDKNTNTARFGILYSDTYTMKDDKIYLHATIEALEDVDIELHYGMQTCYFNPFIGFVTEQGTRETDTSLDTTRKDAQGLPLLVYGRKTNGLTLYVKMFNQGAMAGKRNGNKKAFSLSYGKANTKTYHWVYGNGTNGIMKKGDKNFYAGFFSISDQKPEQFLKDCR